MSVYFPTALKMLLPLQYIDRTTKPFRWALGSFSWRQSYSWWCGHRHCPDTELPKENSWSGSQRPGIPEVVSSHRLRFCTDFHPCPATPTKFHPLYGSDKEFKVNGNLHTYMLIKHSWLTCLKVKTGLVGSHFEKPSGLLVLNSGQKSVVARSFSYKVYCYAVRRGLMAVSDRVCHLVAVDSCHCCS